VSADEDLAPRLEVELLSPNPLTRVIALRGELDIATVSRFQAALDEVVGRDGMRVLVTDLTALTFLDSSGLAAMLSVVRRLDRIGARLVVACANPTVLRLFEVTRTDETLEICRTLEQALGRAEAGPA
jgi:anti-sigma B factor antagonist